MVPNENEWHAWHNSERRPPARRPYQQAYGSQPPAPRPFVQEDTLKELFVQVERKLFTVTLKENLRGRFLRITEEANERRITVIIPATGLEDFQTVINEMVKASKELPPPSEPAAPAKE